MTGRIRSPFPRDVNVPVRFFDLLTLKDLLRIGLSVGIGFIIAGIAGVILGIVVSAVLIAVTPESLTLDAHTRNFASNWIDQQYGTWVKVRKIDDHTVTLEDGSVVGLVVIHSCDIEMLSEAEQRANQRVIKNLIQTIDFSIEIHSVQMSRDISDLPGSRETGKTTHHYVIVKSGGENPGYLQQRPGFKDGQKSDAKKQTAERCKLISSHLSGADIRSNIVPQPLLETTVDYLCLNEVETSTNGYEAEKLNYRGSHQIIYVSNYPQEVPVGWLADLLNIDGLIDIIQTIEPLTKRERDKLSRTAGKLRLELDAANDPSNLTELQQASQDADDMLDAEVSGESLLNYGVYIIAKDSKEKPVKEALNQVESKLRSYGIEYRQPIFQSWKAAKTESLLQRNELNKSLVVPGESASAGFPFSTHDHIQAGGVTAGIDTRNQMPVLIDRFSWDAPHIVRMGMTGSGKSVGTMLELLRSTEIYLDLQIRILDPKPDYEPLVNALDGETYTIEETDFQTHIPEKVSRYIVQDSSRNKTSELVNTLQAIHAEACANDTRTIVVVDEAHRLLSDPDGAAALSTLVREGRSHSVGVSILTQNSDDLTQSVEGQNLLRNTGCYFFMRHQDVSHSAEDFFDLSQSESIQLRQLATGNRASFSEAVIRGPVNTRLRLRLDPEEADLLLEDG